MRIAASLAIAFGLLAGSRAANAEQRDCEVVFVRAPDPVRHVIESWLRAEPRCSGTIELRVVETESGTLYLIAQRPDGRIHEREVPDAQSAGVLVASWVADDWTSTPPEPEVAPSAAPGTTLTPSHRAPGVTDAPSPATGTRSERWLSAAGMLQTEGEGGVGGRLEIDLFGGRTSKWTLGVAVSGVSSQMTTLTSTGDALLETVDLRAVAVVARTWRLGTSWSARWSSGLGPMFTDARAIVRASSGFGNEMSYPNPSGGSVAYEMSVAIAREILDHRWAITSGVATTLIRQTLDDDETRLVRNKLEVMFVLGARYRL